MTPEEIRDLKPRLEVIAGGLIDPPRSDLTNAEFLVRLQGHRLRYVWERRSWIAWEGDTGLWRPSAGEAERAAKDTARALPELAVSVADEEQRTKALKWAATSQSEPRIRAMLALAATETAIVAREADLDRDPLALTVANGTVDLATGELRPHDPADLITRGTPVAYRPDARRARWERFLLEIFDRDLELILFVQRLCGYALTGATTEHVLAVLHGAGCNGKSTFVETLKTILGDLATTAAFDTFARARGDRGPRNDLARLRGARLVTASESGEGRRLDEATVKEITGGDTIAARFLYGEHFEFRPEFTLMLVTNHRPRVDGDDDAIWRRLRLIPFEQSFLGREDRELTATLRREREGILAWMVEGCLDWQQHGLGQAGAVTRATTAYRADEDHLGAFLDERCTLAGETPAGDLRTEYEAWCAEQGERPLAGNVLGRRLARRGIRPEQRSKGRRVYVGVTLARGADADGSGNIGNSPLHPHARGVPETAALTATRTPSAENNGTLTGEAWHV